MQAIPQWLRQWARWFKQARSRVGKRPASRLNLEQLEDRLVPAAGSITGAGNNLLHPNWGKAGVDLLRTAPAAYADGISEPRTTAKDGSDLPSARLVSNMLAAQGDVDIINNRGMSAMVYAWGQFIDHDIDLTPNADPAKPFNVVAPPDDLQFGTQPISLNRSLTDPKTGKSAKNPLQQVNAITAFIDGSQVYGSDDATAHKLRTLSGGKLKTSPGADGILGTADDLLPFNNAETFPTGTLHMANDAHLVPDNQLFAAGDVRANENIELTSLQTLFVREHNRIAASLAKLHPKWTDEQLYQGARAQVIGEMQAITYNEWLPALLGPNALPAYKGYNPHVNPGIANEFSTAMFRVGHSMLGNDVEFLNNSGLKVTDEIPLSQAFFNPTKVQETGIDPILKYLASDPSSEIDNKVVDGVRNFLFGPPGAGGLDLASLNIQRGRDHGLADYNTIRAAYGLPRVHSFAQITANVDVQNKLKQLYGNVNNIDAWVGALAEDHVKGTSTGPLIRKVLVDQFSRLRDGDRFWYQNQMHGADLARMQNTTLADIIRRNSDTQNLQHNVFSFKASIAGAVLEQSGGGRAGSSRGLVGVTINLTDSDGMVVGAAVTDARGRYRFNQGTGIKSTGQYTIGIVAPAGYRQLSPDPTAVLISRGDMNINGVNYVLTKAP